MVINTINIYIYLNKYIHIYKYNYDIPNKNMNYKSYLNY